MPGPIESAGGIKEPTEYATLSMDAQFTGLWTQRNPLRDADVPYLYRKFYSASRFDSMLDGINREISARLTDVRRAGSVEYNTNSFPAANSFYSYKWVQNGSEQLRVLLDGRDGVIYDATAGQKSTVFTKSAGAGKARFIGVNNELFFCDGPDLKKWLQPGAWIASSPIAPGTLINTGANPGTLQMALGGITLAIVASACTGFGKYVIWVDPTQVPDQFANLQGVSVTFSGLSAAAALNGNTYTADILSSTQGVMIVSQAGANYNETAESGSGTTGTGITGGSAPAFSSTRFAITADGGQQWKCYGSAIENWTPAPPTTAPTASPAPSSGARWWQPKTTIAAYYAILDSNQNVQIYNGAGARTGFAYPTWALQPATTYAQTFDGGVIWISLGPVGTWSPATVYAAPFTAVPSPVAVILDPNGNWQWVTNGDGGMSGSAQPTWAKTVGATTSGDGALTWTCLGPGVPMTTQSVSYAFSLHGVDGTVTTASPQSTIQGPIVGPPLLGFSSPTAAVQTYLALGGSFTDDQQCDQVYIWRTAQGQSTLVFEDAVPVDLFGGSLLYDEIGIPDTSTAGQGALNPLIIAPIASAGNPPPARMTCPAYHLGRVWGIVDNRVVNSAGPDTNFNGNTVFPPLSQAIFPALAKRLLPVTVSNGGLLVWTSSGVQIILGTGTAANPFYATMYEPSVNLGGYDALDVLGSTVYFMESNGKVSSFDPQSGYTEIGFPVGDQFKKVTTGGISASLYDPSTTFLSWNIQSSGETAMYVADGAVGWFRMAAIAPPENGLVWCPRAAIAGGTSAVQSIETSPGNYDLLIGPASSGPILKRDTTGAVFGDNGTSYPAWDSKGVVRLCESGQVAEVAHIALKSMATGGPRPSVSILMDEAAPSTDAPWDELAISSTDPPDLEPSVSMYSDRYQALQNGVTPKGDCLLLKVDYGTNSFGDELLMFSIYGRKQEERVQQQ